MGQTETTTTENRGVLAGLKSLYARHEAFWEAYYERVHPALHVVVVALSALVISVGLEFLWSASGGWPPQVSTGLVLGGASASVVGILFADYATGRWP